MIKIVALAALLCLSEAAQAQTVVEADPRLQTITYDAGQIVPIRIAVGYQLTVELAPDEHIENIAVGDAGAWQVTPNKRGDHLFIKALQSGVSTNLTVVTDARTYVFDLISLYGPTPDMAYTLSFLYPATDATVATPKSDEVGRYILSGTRALRPTAIDDDGHQTRIDWRADQPLPAIFVIDENGQERPVEGAMRAGTFVIDGVANQVVFRIDRKIARATRTVKRGLR